MHQKKDRCYIVEEEQVENDSLSRRKDFFLAEPFLMILLFQTLVIHLVRQNTYVRYLK